MSTQFPTLFLLFYPVSVESHYENQLHCGNSWLTATTEGYDTSEAKCTSYFSTTRVRSFFTPCLCGSRWLYLWAICSAQSINYIKQKPSYSSSGWCSGGTSAATIEEGDRNPSWRSTANPEGDHRDSFCRRTAQGTNVSFGTHVKQLKLNPLYCLLK